MSDIFRRNVPVGLAAFIIGFLFVDYYVKIALLRNIAVKIIAWAVILTAMAVGVGMLNIIFMTYNKIQKRDPYWYLDIYMLIVAVVVGITGVIGAYGTHPTYTWILSNIYLPIDATIFSMVCFDIVAAFYRTFRVRNKEATLLTLSALFIMIRNAPISGIIPSTRIIGNWILDVPTLGATRAFVAVIAIGLIGFAIRTLMGKERPSLGVFG